MEYIQKGVAHLQKDYFNLQEYIRAYVSSTTKQAKDGSHFANAYTISANTKIKDEVLSAIKALDETKLEKISSKKTFENLYNLITTDMTKVFNLLKGIKRNSLEEELGEELFSKFKAEEFRFKTELYKIKEEALKELFQRIAQEYENGADEQSEKQNEYFLNDKRTEYRAALSDLAASLPEATTGNKTAYPEATGLVEKISAMSQMNLVSEIKAQKH